MCRQPGSLGIALAACVWLTGVNPSIPAEAVKGLAVPGADIELSPFETHSVPVAIARDRKTGRTFNVVRLPNGRMMAMQSVERLGGRLSYSDDSEMMYGNHPGSSR
jgi:hypothetical protein